MSSCRVFLCGRCSGRAGCVTRRAPIAIHPRRVSTRPSNGPGGFRPDKVAVVTKTTRYEFEQQRYRSAGLSEDELRALVSAGGCKDLGCLWGDERRNEGIDVRVVKRRDYDEETVRWADAIISAGGDGTMLLAASKVLDKFKPVIGVNTDPERSEGHLCLPVQYTRSFPEALHKLYRGEFRWQWRQRIRLFLEGTGINLTPVDLHEQQLSLEQHSKAHSAGGQQVQSSATISGPHLLPVRALNEIFIGESLSSRASYYEISVDDGPWEKQKSSGLNVCTGTGSKAWSYNINKMAPQTVEEILNIVKRNKIVNLSLDRDFVERGEGDAENCIV
ncbi:hypothetical protein GDO78_007949 [Eleutherodactylus coqui]|uniref:NAD(+) kinase n=1 Tax=Eleutherodactylus coqui TaxID=57060 RepID=A0A8J6FIM0_ELECQ|nr:hypothetical protein GDO78_007949 [Eleutherodactylus coqui]